MSNFLSDAENVDHLASLVPGFDGELYRSFGHNQFEAAFRDRVFVVYEAAGLNSDDTPKQPATVLTQLKVLDFNAEADFGSEILIRDMTTGNELWIGHIPTRVFNYKLFLQVPPKLELKWDGQLLRNGQVKRSLSFGILIKTSNASRFASKGNTYCLPPNKFRKLYPDAELSLV